MEPGSTHGYHGHTTGYIAGELIHRVDPQHRSFGQFVREELDKEYYVGVPNDEVASRVAFRYEKQIDKESNEVSLMHSIADQTLTCSGALPLEQAKMIYNEPEIHLAELPAVNGITNARSLAEIYSLLIGDVYEKGQKFQCLLSEKTLSEAIKNATPDGELDQTLYNMPTIFSKGGFQINDGVFGHTGKNESIDLILIKIIFLVYGGSCAFAYPQKQLTYVHVCSQLDPLTLTIDERNTHITECIENILKQHDMSFHLFAL